MVENCAPVLRAPTGCEKSKCYPRVIERRCPRGKESRVAVNYNGYNNTAHVVSGKRLNPQVTGAAGHLSYGGHRAPADVVSQTTRGREKPHCRRRTDKFPPVPLVVIWYTTTQQDILLAHTTIHKKKKKTPQTRRDKERLNFRKRKKVLRIKIYDEILLRVQLATVLQYIIEKVSQIKT